MMRFLCFVLAVGLTACGSSGRGTPNTCVELGGTAPGRLGASGQRIAIEVRFLTIADDFFDALGVDFSDIAVPVSDEFPSYGGSVATAVDIGTSASVVGGESGSQAVVPVGRHVGSFFPIARTTGAVPDLDAVTAFVQAPGANDQCLTIADAVALALSGPPGSLATRPFVPFGALPAGQGVAYHLFDSIGLATALATIDPGDILRAPQITMFEGQRACVLDHAARPFVTSLTTVSVGAIGFTPVRDFLLSGVTLDVKPTIGPDPGSVNLEIRPTSHAAVLQHVGAFDLNGTPVTLQIPLLATAAQRTSILVPDGGTVLLGGIKLVADAGKPGVPLLSQIPYVNRLFRSGTARPVRDELMILITPRIIIQE